MKLEQSFEVAAPLERVWEALIDVERVAPCLPGAAITGRNDDGSYDGTFKVKIGPTTASYSGKLQMENVDDRVHSATMQAQGTDKRGQGGAKATIVSSVSKAGAGATRVEVSTDYHITGRLARFGRGGMIEDISTRLLNEFAKCLQTSLAGDGGPAVVPAAAATAGAAGASKEDASGAADVQAPAGASEAPDVQAPVEASTAPSAEPDASAAEPSAPPAEPSASSAAPEEPSAAPEKPSATAPPPSPPEPPRPSSPPMPESEPVQGLSLMASALWGQAKRKPAPVAALVFGFLLALRLLRRGR